MAAAVFGALLGLFAAATLVAGESCEVERMKVQQAPLNLEDGKTVRVLSLHNKF